MALTKISTGGVKDDTADEAKLKVSNAGTNGQFLQKQSGDTGGLTWASVPAGVGGTNGFTLNDNVQGQFGTSNSLDVYYTGSESRIQSTGAGEIVVRSAASDGSNVEVNAKFIPDGAVELYSDGSKKLNTYSGGVEVTGLKVLDNNKLKIGNAEDLQIYHDGDHSFIKNTTGHLKIGDANVRIMNAACDEDMIHAKQNEGVELYYDNNKKLETTSTGINVTGAINVNGSALSTSPTITANADGAIGAGDPVEIQTNGTVKKITQTVSVLSTPSLTVAKTVPPSEVAAGNDGSIAYWPDKSSFVFTFKGSSNHRFFNTGKVSGTSFTYGTAEELTTNNNNDTTLTHATGDHFVVNWRKPSDNDVYVENLEVTKTNDTTYSYALSNATKLFDTAHDLDFAKVDSSGNYFLCVARDSDNSNYGLSRMVYRNSSGAFTAGTEQDTVNTASFAPSSVTATQPFIIWDSNVSRAIVLYNKGGSGDKFTYNIGTPNYSTTNPTMTWLTTTPSVGTNSSYDDNPSAITGYFDSKNNRIVVIWEEQTNDGTQSNRGKIIVGTVTGGSTNSISWGSVTTFDNYYTYKPQCEFDTTAGVGLVHYSIAAGNEPSYAYRITVDPSDNSVTLSNKLSSGMVTGGGAPNGDRSICFDVANGLFIAQQTDSANNYRNVQYGIAAATSTTTASNYLGLNQAAVTDGNAATIDLIGAVNENQSSLTIGSDYYVQPDGTLGTSAGNPSVHAGKAVAATKLVVKG